MVPPACERTTFHKVALQVVLALTNIHKVALQVVLALTTIRTVA